MMELVALVGLRGIGAEQRGIREFLRRPFHGEPRRRVKGRIRSHAHGVSFPVCGGTLMRFANLGATLASLVPGPTLRPASPPVIVAPLKIRKQGPEFGRPRVGIDGGTRQTPEPSLCLCP